jgi:hypothetical protein
MFGCFGLGRGCEGVWIGASSSWAREEREECESRPGVSLGAGKIRRNSPVQAQEYADSERLSRPSEAFGTAD